MPTYTNLSILQGWLEVESVQAVTMDRTPVASVELPRIPNGFHGSWIPAAVAN